jgi:hypothetical protein
MKINKTKLRDIFDTLLKTEYKDHNDIQELNKFYIDKFNYLFNILSNKNNFIVGRRGTGKTTLLYRAYLECMLSFNKKHQSEFLSTTNNLGMYIDLNKINTLKNDNSENFERDFLLDLVKEFREQVNIFWKRSITSILTQSKNETDEIFNEIEQLIINGTMIDIVGDVSLDKIKNSNVKLVGKTNLINMKLNAEVCNKETIKNSYKVNAVEMSVSLFYDKLHQIKQKAKINNIFIFLDEFSSLSEIKQIKLSKLLKKLFDSRINIYYKIGVIADNYNFGELRLDRDLHEISLDLDMIISSAGSIEKGLEHLSSFIKSLLEQRVKYFLPENELNDIFLEKNFDEIILELTKASMGVSRTLGRILEKSLQKTLNSNNDYINLTHIKEAIRENSIQYNEYFNGMIKKGIVAKEYKKLLNDIIYRAIQEQTKNKDKQSSFFTWLPSKEFYLSKLEENYLLHKIQHNHRLKDGKIDIDIFAIDYGLCLEHKLNYYSSSKEKRQDRDIVQSRFFYDSVAIKYDSFFIEEDIHKCGICGDKETYTKKDLTLPNGKVINFCPTHNEQALIIIKRKISNIHKYTEEEEKIIGLLATIKKKDSLKANEIQKEVGVNPYKIAWFIKKIEQEQGYLKRITNINPFQYYGNLDDE